MFPDVAIVRKGVCSPCHPPCLAHNRLSIQVNQTIIAYVGVLVKVRPEPASLGVYVWKIEGR